MPHYRSDVQKYGPAFLLSRHSASHLSATTASPLSSHHASPSSILFSLLPLLLPPPLLLTISLFFSLPLSLSFTPSPSPSPSPFPSPPLPLGQPLDVVVRRAETVQDSFDPRHCTGKLYRYTISCGPTRPVIGRDLCWHIKSRLDLDAMRTAAAFLVGRLIRV